MKRIAWKAIVGMTVLALLFLSACHEEMSPITNGSVSYLTSNKTWVEKQLTQDQLMTLSAWLIRGSANWGRCFITPPGSTINISLKHSDGSSSYLSLLNFTQSQTQTTMLAQHLSGSNLSDQPCALQSFSPKDIDDLRAILMVGD